MSSLNARNSSPRRSPTEWQTLVDEWQASDISAKQFCSERDIGYASFCQWRKRLTAPDKDAEKGRGVAPGFIDLSALDPGSSRNWEIVLSLGNGVELKLSQR